MPAKASQLSQQMTPGPLKALAAGEGLGRSTDESF